MKLIKLWFSDFYDGFNPEDNYLYHLLSNFYKIEITSEKPDYLIFSCYGNEFLNYDCIRIFYTGENLRPDFNVCDYAIGFDHMEFGERYLRYPNYAFIHDQFLQLVKPEVSEKIKAKNKDHFCNFIYANSQADPIRDKFFHLLNEYKPVASPGKHLNNTSMEVGERFSEDWMYTKLEFQRRCKFSIAFENTSTPGYTTEKIMHAFIAGTIPIYWGNPEVAKDFNPASFINCHDFDNFNEVIIRVKEIDENDELYDSIVAEPAFKNNTIPAHLEKEHLIKFLRKILDQNKIEAKQRPSFGTTLKYENDLRNLHQASYRYARLQPYLKYFKVFKK